MILSNFKTNFAFVLLDNIVIFSRTTKLHIDHVRKALLLIRNKRAPLRLKKGSFFIVTINSLGHNICHRV